LPTCYGLVSDTANYLDMSRCRQQLVHSKSAASWQQVVVMEFGQQHHTTDTTDCCPRQLVTDLLRTCRSCCRLAMGKSSTCYRLATGKLVQCGHKDKALWGTSHLHMVDEAQWSATISH